MSLNVLFSQPQVRQQLRLLPGRLRYISYLRLTFGSLLNNSIYPDIGFLPNVFGVPENHFWRTTEHGSMEIWEKKKLLFKTEVSEPVNYLLIE